MLERSKFYFNRVVVRFGTFKNKDNAENVDDRGPSYPVQNFRMVRGLLRKERYFDRPNLYVKRNELIEEEEKLS